MSKQQDNRSKARVFALLGATALLVSGCSGPFDYINGKTKFSSSEYGVAASPRLTSGKDVPHGGGRYMVGKPYKVAGNWYKPHEQPNLDITGAASWYGPNFHGRQTANGEIFNAFALTAAHPTLPLPSYVRVTNLANNSSIVVRVNDRGPFVSNRVIDLSERAAAMLGYDKQGTARVRVQYVGKAPLEGDDTKFLLASYNAPTIMETNTQNSDTRIASIPSAPSVQSSAATGSLVEDAPFPAQRPAFMETAALSSSGLNAIDSATVYPAQRPVDLLGYASASHAGAVENGDKLVNSAVAAAQAMATRASGLNAWQESMDVDSRKIHLELGAFTSPETIREISQSFALLGALDEDSVTVGGKPATLLSLSYLKPGVTRKDVADMVAELGLKNAVLHN